MSKAAESMKIIVATRNPGKLTEISAMLPDSFDIVGLEQSDIVMPPETGASFGENAYAKAHFVASQLCQFSLADDSGLVVDALSGGPGIFSARYAGEHASDAENTELLLRQMGDIPTTRRSARFVCALALVGTDGLVARSEGELEGSIGASSRGENGFGYDPVFVLPDGRHLAELSADEKNEISHRSVALRRLIAKVDWSQLNCIRKPEAQ